MFQSFCLLLVRALLLVAACSLAQENELPVLGAHFDPTPITIPGVQKLARRPITSMDLIAMRDLHGVRISPDGKSIAYVVGQAVYETNSYRSTLFVISTEPGHTPVSLGSAGPPKWTSVGEWDSEDPQWSSDSRHIARRMQVKGTWQVFLWDPIKGGPPAQLTQTPYNVQSFYWSADGRKVFFTVRKLPDPSVAANMNEHGILYDGWVMPWRPRPIVDEEVGRIPADVEEWVHDVAAGTERKAVPEDHPQPEGWRDKLGGPVWTAQSLRTGTIGKILNPKLSPDQKRAIYQVLDFDPSVSPRTSFPLYVTNLETGTATRVNPPGESYVGEYWWSLDSKKIFFVESRGDGRSPTLFVAAADASEPLRELAQGRLGEYLDNFSVDNGMGLVACVRQNNTTPGQVAVLDLKTGALRIFADVNPEFQNFTLSTPERMDWKNRYGFDGHGYLVKPLHYKEGARYPLVITMYTSGDYFLRGGVGDEYPIQVFAANGFAVLAFNATPVPNHKHEDFESAMLRFRSPLASLEQALTMLDAKGIVDPKRRGITGISYGEEILEYAISHSNLFQAASASSLGGWNPGAYYMFPTGLRTLMKDWGLGLPDGSSSARWHDLSAALNADKIDTPLLSNAADMEYVAGLQLYTTLLEMGKPVELFVYPEELHVKYQPKHRYEIYNRNLDWFSFWLLDKENNDGTKNEQFARWRKLKILHDDHRQVQNH